jgi:hypothetical protein
LETIANCFFIFNLAIQQREIIERYLEQAADITDEEARTNERKGTLLLQASSVII